MDDPFVIGDYEDIVDASEPLPPVRLKWVTPNGDDMIAHMARVSNSSAKPGDPAERLIAYLLRKHHWSPFEMANLCVEVHTERDISAQILRHWSMRFQEFSTRYAEVEDLRWSTECRFQHPTNRQASVTFEERIKELTDEGYTDAVPAIDATLAYFDAVVNETRTRSLEAYQELLARGVAKECARRILPIGLMPTVLYINGNLRSWITYFLERSAPATQKEHRAIAQALEPLFIEHFPLVWKAVQLEKARQDHQVFAAEQYDQIVDLFSQHSERNGGSGDVVDDVVDLVKELLAG